MAARKKAKESKHPVIEVKDFGPIIKGRVELRPLTVFAGPSNTGKSWLATLVYALLHQDNESWLSYRRIFGKNLLRFPEEPATWIENLKEGSSIQFTAGDKQFLKSVFEHGIGNLQEEILRCFGLSDPAHLVREQATRTNSATIKFQATAGLLPGQYKSKLSIGRKASCSVDPPSSMHVPPLAASSHRARSRRRRLLDALRELKGHQDEVDSLGSTALRSHFVNIIFSSLEINLGIPRPYSSVWYLPADRGGVIHAHHVVVNALIQSASRAGIYRQPSIPMLSGILSDFLENLINLAQVPQVPRRKRDENHESAENLEKKVMGGPVNIERTEVNYPRFSWWPDGWERPLPLLNVSSMVSELAPVALYLRHNVSPGDLLILEEPEAHLHPAKQVALIQEVAAWVRSGIRVILTTHSEWVLEELSNLVATGATSKNPGLDEDDVGLWLFETEEDDSGSTIREIPWDLDEGGFDSDFHNVAASLHNRWADLIAGKKE